MSDQHTHFVVVGDDRVGVRVLEELVSLGWRYGPCPPAQDTAFARSADAADVRSWSATPRAPASRRRRASPRRALRARMLDDVLADAQA